jgi:quercetin dioxygenase-like cupin family protein
MKILTGGCRVYSAEDGQFSTLGNWTARTVISQDSGAQRITQTVSDYAPGLSPAVVNPKAEEVLYVASGEGKCRVSGFEYTLSSGAAFFCSPWGGLQHREHWRGFNSSGQLVLPRGPAAAYRRWSAASRVRQTAAVAGA